MVPWIQERYGPCIFCKMPRPRSGGSLVAICEFGTIFPIFLFWILAPHGEWTCTFFLKPVANSLSHSRGRLCLKRLCQMYLYNQLPRTEDSPFFIKASVYRSVHKRIGITDNVIGIANRCVLGLHVRGVGHGDPQQSCCAVGLSQAALGPLSRSPGPC